MTYNLPNFYNSTGGNSLMDESSTGREEFTALLNAYRNGNPKALGKLMDEAYPKLCRIARSRLRLERHNHTLQSKALVNEAFIELVEQKPVDLQSRRDFFRFMAFLMRRVLMEYARERNRLKRGGEYIKVSLEDVVYTTAEKKDIYLDQLDDALKELARVDKKQAEIIAFRYYGGYTIEETAEIFEIPTATVRREWSKAQAWLLRYLKGESNE